MTLLVACVSNPVPTLDLMGTIGYNRLDKVLFQATSLLNEAKMSANSSYTVVISHIYDVLFCLTYCYLSDYTSIPFLFGPKEFALPTKTNRQLRQVERNKDLSSAQRCRQGWGFYRCGWQCPKSWRIN
jgi:hypothetical protein